MTQVGLNNAGLNGLASLGQSGLNQLNGLCGYQPQVAQAAVYDLSKALATNETEASKLDAVFHEACGIYDRLNQLGDRVFGPVPQPVANGAAAPTPGMARTIESLQAIMRDISQQLSRLERIA